MTVSANDIQQDDGFVPCKHCGRTFNEKAAERHIPRCAEKAKLDKFRKPVGRRR
jgi:hypothetical protein